MFCRHCGKENKDEAVICVGCGCPIGSGKVKKKSNSDNLKKVLGIISLCLGIWHYIIGLLFILRYGYGIIDEIADTLTSSYYIEKPWSRAYNISVYLYQSFGNLMLGTYFVLQFVMSRKRQEIK